MKKFWVRVMSLMSVIALLMGAATPVYAAKDLVASGTGATAAVSASASEESSSSTASKSSVSTAAATGSNSSVSTATGTNQKSATTSTAAVQTGVVDDSIPFVLLIGAALFLMITLIRSNINRKRYGNYGEYWMEQMIEYEKRMQAK